MILGRIKSMSSLEKREQREESCNAWLTILRKPHCLLAYTAEGKCSRLPRNCNPRGQFPNCEELGDHKDNKLSQG